MNADDGLASRWKLAVFRKVEEISQCLFTVPSGAQQADIHRRSQFFGHVFKEVLEVVRFV